MSDSRRPAVQGDHARWDVDLRHRVCDRRVERGGSGLYTCAGMCRISWKADVMNKFTDKDMDERFYVNVPQDNADYVLVERCDEFSKRSFTTLVRRSELKPTDKKVKP